MRPRLVHLSDIVRPSTRWRFAGGVALVVASLAVASRASAEPPLRAPIALQARSPATSPEAAAAARTHFQHAKQLYKTGAYRESIAELEAARALDPNAKELVFNLGVVTERLGEIDASLGYFRQYLTMDVTPGERTKAEAYVRRLEGAKHEVPSHPNRGADAPSSSASRGLSDGASQDDASRDASEPLQPEAHRGKVDLATVATATVAVAGFAVGTIFAIKALDDRPKSGFVTGQDGWYADMQSRVDKAHREAVVADVGFGVGILAAVATALLYFGRTSDPSDAPPALATVSAGPVRGGGAAFVGGRF